jgi:hypothetical protein
MDKYIKYSIINGELNLYVTAKEYEKLNFIGSNKPTKLNFHIINKEPTNEQFIKKKVLAEIEELKELVQNLNN